MHPAPQVLVYEQISGGNWPVQRLPDRLVMEGLAMLWSTLADFHRWGAVRTVTILDPRLEDFVPGLNRNTLPAGRVVSLPVDSAEDAFGKLLPECEAALIIAPEADGELALLSGAVLAAGIQLLGSHPKAVRVAGDKAVCASRFQKAGLPMPHTKISVISAAAQAAEEFGYPLVIKPADGVGCAGVCLVRGPGDMGTALENLAAASRSKKLILQSWVSGVHASVSLLVAGDRVVPLSLNNQWIKPGIPFLYHGGQVPLNHALAERACEVACGAVASIPGLQGYVGVDLVIDNEEAWLIEINPRLTTAYIGLRQVLPFNLAQAIWSACTQGSLPELHSLNGQVDFRPDEPETWFQRLPGRLVTA